MKKSIVEKLVEAQKKKILCPFAHALLAVFGVEIPRVVVLGKGCCFAHRAPGLVIHPNTRIGSNAHFYQGVTLGVACPWKPLSEIGSEGYFVDVQDDVILCAGC